MTTDHKKPDLSTIPIPSLNPAIKLYEAGHDNSGQPIWRIYNPISHKYFQINWAEFECLVRFQECKTAQNLQDRLHQETSLKITAEELVHFITFLNKNGLLSSKDSFSGDYEEPARTPLWKKMLHHYLFFTIPLFKPDHLLNASYKHISPFFSKGFFQLSMLILFWGALMTIGRFDEFTHTFFMFLSLEGAITIFVTFFFIKLLHEFGHAFTAHKYGVNVPHMGVAFMVMYPVLYTETSGAWRLKSKKQRMNIGLAGIRTELILAAYALALWHVLPPGMAQSLCFSIVTISLLGSLLINLNPLMRFDGYFVLSDYMGIENMHAQGFAAARWWIRKTLFGLPDDPPEDSDKTLKFLVVFGLLTLTYRFALFLGIAFLVYHVFFKPLGLFLMIVELAWFIFLPALSELKIWWKRRSDIYNQRRGRISLILAGLALIIFIMPTSTTLTIPAVMHSNNVRTLYAPAPATIESIKITNSQRVSMGDTLFILSSPVLQKEYMLAKAKHDKLMSEKKSLQSAHDEANAKQRLSSIDTEIKAAQEQAESLHTRIQKLVITAPLAGTIKDLDHNLYIGQTIKPDDLLARIIPDNQSMVTAYANENQVTKIQIADHGRFRANSDLFDETEFSVKFISPVNISAIDWPELASIYGGPLASELSNSSSGHAAPVPRQSLYQVELEAIAADKTDPPQGTHVIAQKGHVKIDTPRHSPAFHFMQKLMRLVLKELNLN
ncbi:MAG: hypothetical protein CMH27_08625 [Micavibrio sp.]|nr:hypothetical protein [Micavibrio sp.]|tara:strand:+ start:2940 stop:5108 length:2169 start_codon:yes stop_codon:yes gene_type:complete